MVGGGEGERSYDTNIDCRAENVPAASDGMVVNTSADDPPSIGTGAAGVGADDVDSLSGNSGTCSSA